MSEHVNWDEYRDADLFLFIYARIHSDELLFNWWPRSLVYMGDSYKSPRFLVESTLSVEGAKSLAEAVGVDNIEKLPDLIQQAVDDLTKMARQQNIFADPLGRFDPKKILIS